MSDQGPLLNVRDLLTLVDGSYVEPGFVARVGPITPRQGKAPMRAKMLDIEGGDRITCALWGAPRILEGQVVEFTGRGITMKDFNNEPQVSVSNKVDVRVVGGGIPRNAVGPAGRPSRPEDYAQRPPAGGMQSDFSTDPHPETIAANNAANFFKGMDRQALLLAHCWIYARRLFQKLQAECGFVFDKTEEESWIRATAHALHIEANRKGLDSIVVNLDAPRAPSPPPPAPRPRPAPPPPPAADRTREPERFQDQPGDEVRF